MAEYAHVSDLQRHWSGFDLTQSRDAESKLDEAEVEVLALYPDIRTRIESGDLDRRAVTLVLCRMVKRAMESPADGMEGLESITRQTGPFAGTLNFRTSDGALYLTKADRRLLSSGRDTGKAFTIMPGGTR